jgi:hypothetical protein
MLLKLDRNKMRCVLLCDTQTGSAFGGYTVMVGKHALCYTITVGKHALCYTINVFYSKIHTAGAKFTVSLSSSRYECYTEENHKERKCNAQVTNLQ